jgi:MraZ protein
MFRGAAKVTIDDKGRVVVPTQHRADLAAPAAGRVVVTVHQDQCLLIYAFPEWEKVEERLMAAPNMNNPRALSLQRLLIGHAQEMVLDSHGRLALTPELREFAGLERAAWIVGQGKRLELWDEARWKLQRDAWMKHEQGAEEAAPGLSDLSL